MTEQGKHHVFIVSSGRTGTKFFGQVLGRLIADAVSVHEPDTLGLNLRDLLGKVRRFGAYHMVLGRILGRTGIRNLTRARLAGRLTDTQVRRGLEKQRGPFYRSLSAPLIIESHNKFYGLLDALPLQFPQHRIVCIVRDPRTFANSLLNTGYYFGSGDWVAKLGFPRLSPGMIGDPALQARWPGLSPFEKTCWYWRTVYRTIGASLSHLEHARLFRFEDLFLSEERGERLRELLDFITVFPDRTFPYRFDPGVLDRKVHASSPKGRLDWRQWTPEQAKAMDAICGPEMRAHGYGLESEWLALLAAAH